MLNSLVSPMTCSEFEQGRSFFSPCVEMTLDQFSFLTGIYTVGGLIGSLFAGNILQRKGRRRAALTSTTLIALGSFIMAISGHLSLLVIGRFLSGIGCGLATVVVPLILDRLAQATSIGRIGIFNQMAITIGILTALALAIPLGSRTSWRWVPAVSMIIAGAQLLTSSAVPDSVFSLQAQQKIQSSPENEERGLLPKAPGERSAEREDEELDLPDFTKPASLGLFETITSKDPNVRSGLTVVLLTMVMQQLSGINTVMYYSTEILSGVIPTGARYISLLVAVANCVLTLAPMVLVSYIGRKSLLLISSALCGFTTCALGLGIRTNSPLIAGVMVIAFVSSFSLGLGAIPFMLIAEVMPEHAAGAAGSLGLTVNWAVCGLIAIAFNKISDAAVSLMGTGGIFFAFGLSTFVLTVAVSYVYRESK